MREHVSEQLRVELYFKLLSFLTPCYRLRRIYKDKLNMWNKGQDKDHVTTKLISLLSGFHQYLPNTVLFLHGFRVKSKLCSLSCISTTPFELQLLITIGQGIQDSFSGAMRLIRNIDTWENKPRFIILMNTRGFS